MLSLSSCDRTKRITQFLLTLFVTDLRLEMKIVYLLKLEGDFPSYITVLSSVSFIYE